MKAIKSDERQLRNFSRSLADIEINENYGAD